VADWNRLPEGASGTSLVKTHVFRKRVMWNLEIKSEVKGGYMVRIAQPV
jgi:hypothetical protein